MRHKFIKNAKKTSILVDPINKYQKWKSKNPKDQSDDDDPSEEINSTVRVSSNTNQGLKWSIYSEILDGA